MNPLAVYVHIPFCTVKCGYCDFNAYAGMDGLKGDYTDAVVAEIAGWGRTLRERLVTSIAFGGGTPGELPPAAIADIVTAVAAGSTTAEGVEITLEANPGTSSPRVLAGFRNGGVTRISFGVQSFHASELAFLDRLHSPEAACASVRAARGARFASLNVDLIYGLPGQPLAAWLSSIRQTIALEPDHVSAYALTVEEGTLLGKRVRQGLVTMPGDDLVAEMYEAGGDLLEGAGFRQYELSNWARPGHESRHNQVYWTDGDYLGIGAGAHGYIGGERYENVAHPRSYVRAVAAGSAIAQRYRPSGDLAMVDWVTLALRRIEGFAPEAFAAKFGIGVDAVLGRTLRDCERAGVLERDGHVRVTRRGRLLHGEVAALALAELREGG